MLRHALVPLLLAGEIGTACGQVSLGNGDHVLEIGGSLSMFYNQRGLKEGETDHRKDRFALRDAQIQLEGRYRHLVEYELQVDLADLSRASAGLVDAENPGLMDAYFVCKAIPYVDVQVGYSKVPYGRSAQVPFAQTPYWQRAELLRGEFFSLRDVGVTLTSTFWKQRATVSGGVYTGLGELSLRGENDASGQPEVIGRVEVAFPSRYRHVDVDDRITPVPMVAVGLNGRYADKSQPNGSILPAFAGGEYAMKVIDGVHSAVGGDITAQYKGISAQFEAHQIRLEPRNPNSALLQGLPASVTEGYALAGGYVGQVNYFWKKARSIFSVRYEELNVNDLAPGISRRWGGAYAYQVRGYALMLKAQYWYIQEEETSVDPLTWTEQVRVGLQCLFQ